MPITIDGSGSIGGLSAGGLPDASVTAADLDGGQTGSAPIYGCRAWVNFDGTRDSTGTASTANTNRFIRASGNVTSVLRNGTGDYTVNFTTAMPDANYTTVGNVSVNTETPTANNGVFLIPYGNVAPTTSAARLVVKLHTLPTTASDVAYANVVVFR